MHGEAQKCGDMEQAVLNTRVVDKNQKGYFGSQRSQHHTRPPSPGFQCQELLAVKTSGVWSGRRNCMILRSLFLKGLQKIKDLYILPLGSSTRATAGRAPAAYGEKLKCLESGQVPGDRFLSVKTPEAR